MGIGERKVKGEGNGNRGIERIREWGYKNERITEKGMEVASYWERGSREGEERRLGRERKGDSGGPRERREGRGERGEGSGWALTTCAKIIKAASSPSNYSTHFHT